MAERHDFKATPFVLGLLAVAAGGGYLLTDATDASLDLGGADGAVAGGTVLLVLSLGLLAKVLAQISRDRVATDELQADELVEPETL